MNETQPAMRTLKRRNECIGMRVIVRLPEAREEECNRVQGERRKPDTQHMGQNLNRRP